MALPPTLKTFDNNFHFFGNGKIEHKETGLEVNGRDKDAPFVKAMNSLGDQEYWQTTGAVFGARNIDNQAVESYLNNKYDGVVSDLDKSLTLDRPWKERSPRTVAQLRQIVNELRSRMDEPRDRGLFLSRFVATRFVDTDLKLDGSKTGAPLIELGRGLDKDEFAGFAAGMTDLAARVYIWNAYPKLADRYDNNRNGKVGDQKGYKEDEFRQEILDTVQPRERALFAHGMLHAPMIYSQQYTADRYFDSWVSENCPQPVSPHHGFVFPKKYP